MPTDTKISGMTPAPAALATHEYVVNESGTTKKVTGAQLITLIGTGLPFSGQIQFTGATNPGFTPNNLTTVQRDALGVVPLGTTIYNTTTGRTEYYIGGGTPWQQHLRVNGDTMTGALGIPAGSVGAPALFTTAGTNTGLYFGANTLAVSLAGTNTVRFLPTSLNLVTPLSWGASPAAGDTFLYRAGAGIVQQSNLANAQTFRLYNNTDSDTSPANAEWLSMDWTTNVNYLTLSTKALGTGVARALVLNSAAQPMYFQTAGISRWLLNNAALTPATDLGDDVGSTAMRVRNLYVGTTLDTSNHLIYRDSNISWSGTNAAGGTPQTQLLGNVSDTLSQVRLGNAQTFRLYNTTDNNATPVNAEYLSVDWTSNANIATISAKALGTGVGRAIMLSGVNNLYLGVNGTYQWLMNTATLKPAADNTFDIGTALLRVRNTYTTGLAIAAGGTLSTLAQATAPVASTIALAAGVGMTDGSHSVKVTFVTATGETTAGAVANTVSTVSPNQQINVTAIPLGLAGTVTSRKVYMTAAGNAAVGPWLLVSTIADNTTTVLSINTADGSLGAATPALNTTLDARVTVDAATGTTTHTGTVLVPNGTAAAPSFSYAANPTFGMHFMVGTGTVFSHAGGDVAGIQTGAFVMSPTYAFGWAPTTLNISADTKLYRGAAGTIQQSNGVNAQTFRLYNTTDSDGTPVNAEWLSIDWTAAANQASILTRNIGTGLARVLVFGVGTVGTWGITTTNNFIPISDNTRDFGAAALRIRDAYIARNIIQNVGTQITAAATITPTTPIVHVTGATPIATITVPAGMATAGNGGSIQLVADTAFTWTTAGNINTAGAAIVGKTITFTWDNTAAKWFPPAYGGVYAKFVSGVGVGNGADLTNDALWTLPPVPVNTFSTNGDALVLTLSLMTGATANNKTMGLTVGGTQITTPTTIMNNLSTVTTATITRVDSTHVNVFVSGIPTGGANLGPISSVNLVVADLTANTLAVVVTGSSPTTGAAGDMKLFSGVAEIKQ